MRERVQAPHRERWMLFEKLKENQVEERGDDGETFRIAVYKMKIEGDLGLSKPYFLLVFTCFHGCCTQSVPFFLSFFSLRKIKLYLELYPITFSISFSALLEWLK